MNAFAGGAGIVAGLAILGYKILRVLGVDAVKISNSRGFCAELATAITVVLASRVGALFLPSAQVTLIYLWYLIALRDG